MPSEWRDCRCKRERGGLDNQQGAIQDEIGVGIREIGMNERPWEIGIGLIDGIGVVIRRGWEE